MALKPGTSVDVVTNYVDLADMILVMTVEPGFGGQTFMESMLQKVEWLRENYPALDIEVDGGVGPSTIEACAKVCNTFNQELQFTNDFTQTGFDARNLSYCISFF